MIDCDSHRSRAAGRIARHGWLLLPVGIVVASYAHLVGVSPHVVWAFVAAFVVWAIARWRDVAVTVRQVLASDALRTVTPVWVVTRLGVLVAGYLAVRAAGPHAGAGSFRVSPSIWWNLPARWDGGWYLDIARHGYAWVPALAARQQNVAFFPAHPLAMRYAAEIVTLPARLFRRPDLLGGGDARYLWAGVLVCSVAFFAALVYVYKLTCLDADARAARRAVVLISTYPFAVFFSAPYTEGLFLLALTAAFYHLRRRQYGTAAFAAALTGLTRSNGCAVALALPFVALDRRVPERPVLARTLLVSAMPLVGTAIFSAFVWRLAGDPFAWMRAQAGWGTAFSVTGFVAHRVDRWRVYGGGYFVRTPAELLALGAVALAAVSIPGAARRLNVGYAALVALYLAPAILIDLPEIGRMTAVLFPIFLWLAAVLRGRVFTAAAATFAVLQVLYAVLFFTWRGLG